MKQPNPTKISKGNSQFKRAKMALLLILACSYGFAQNYTWMHGTNLVDQPGVYGTIGVPAVANMPGSRQVSTSWKDASGNFWLFGGIGFDAFSTNGFLNDLWKYNPATNQWTWITGNDASNQSGVYGTIGVPSSLNMPGGREGALSWIDASGNLWMFGGIGWDASSGVGELNDLWKYNIATNQWTWMKGGTVVLQNGVYGTQGTPANANIPGARALSSGWADGSGNLWLFGGEGIDGTGTPGDLNDLWRYNIATNQWTWMKGSSITDQNGVYGIMNVPATGNSPGSRYFSAHWRDALGNFWLCGGAGFDATSGFEDLMNDVWMYNLTLNQWTWMKGSNTSGQAGTYGTQGVPAAANEPGGRLSAISWSDASGNFYLFGGFGYDGMGSFDVMNDLWKFNLASNQWTWIKGSNTIAQSATYGTPAVPAAANTPGARGGSVGWTDASYNLWLFGGSGLDENGNQGDLNDLWRYSSCINSPTLIINSTSPSFCIGGSATLTANGASTYSWSNSQSGSVTVVSPTTSGVSTFTSYGEDQSGCTASSTISVNVLVLPNVNATAVKSVICKGQQTTLNATGASTYSWNTTPPTSGASVVVSPTVTTTYIATGTGQNGCVKTFSLSLVVNPCTGIEAQNNLTQQTHVYPNPNNGVFTVSGNDFGRETTLVIFNTLGQKVFEEILTADHNNIQTQLQNGIYHYSVLLNDQKISSGKIIIGQ